MEFRKFAHFHFTHINPVIPDTVQGIKQKSHASRKQKQ
jgi:hypothetical protein